MNIGRSHSIRSKKGEKDGGASRHHFSMASLRGIRQPELSKKLYQLIKTENHAIGAYEQAGRETQSIASQLSEWGESTDDDGVSDISDKLGVLLAEIAEQEDVYAQNLEESRGVLKQIRNVEASVQPTRTNKQKIQDEIQKLKYKEPESTKLVTLEQELVRAEAQSLVADAQLTNVTRQKFKEAFDLHTAAVIERAEKQIILAQRARHLINLLDDTPIVPGEDRPAFTEVENGRQMLNDAESDLRAWQPNLEPIRTNASKLGGNGMASQELPIQQAQQNVGVASADSTSVDAHQQRVEQMERAQEEGTSQVTPPYPTEKQTENAALAS
ncbi:putative sphingolipid long chain base-responsive protein pil1 [Fulvia fulva]|uniref:Sphingolipid long chain base-responsive protein pil1 n=1 Tax=Passalora fulva TaxID=5499 RepID=A0A9Q8PG89_PASFU|nr:putative sphingolipid long chain base-responsive protein pil1 [Fulvia fulva]KAK4613620.1 putative sphingolipid long chain base-responsive protein pil1 [Fulvia fulva]KAK4614949.1 putative sphingolipid long chain base-responsive protein pil1 [Fulvia fulva]UJO21847.1 putative sphingolipid long chain base-responsive protein pil1 [Fulvia fulva]WPV20557.1 putative sphingolipid long chain base-responsive protein pil1 [Fulvia fulva]WPV34849.1 putative sphingolipid long chain base-responsive protein